ncbi:MAG: Asp-tRNA(Asn)/Glu-tRNA(Gln) amidotransferase subunit GatC [Verrucomicrobiota bacterium]
MDENGQIIGWQLTSDLSVAVQEWLRKPLAFPIGLSLLRKKAMDTEKDPIDLDRLSVLARLSLTPEEKEKLGPQLSRIVGYVEQLKEVDVDGVEPMAHAIPLSNVLREDRAEELDDREAFLKNAPASRLSQIVVPPVIE